MGSREVQPVASPVRSAVLRAARDQPAAGWSRRQLLRRAVGAGIGLWLVEMSAWAAVGIAMAVLPDADATPPVGHAR